VEKSTRVKTYLEDAWSFFKRGVEELEEEGVKLGDAVRIRDAAEKLWNAVVSATNALILHMLDVVPASRWERRRLLEKLEERPEVERLGLRDRYGARERYLHQMTFYDGIIDLEMLKIEVEKVRRYISDVERLIGQ